MEKYDSYKDSGVEWIGEVPEGWNTPWGNYVFNVFNERSAKGEETLLTVSEHHGIKKRSEHNVTMFMAESYEGYKTCFPGDLVINSLWAWSKGLGFSEYHGLVSTAYSVYRPDHEKYDYKFLHYLLRTDRYVARYLIASKGIWISRLILSDWAFLRIPVLSPPKPEQTAIANFLDQKTALIDRAIAQKERLIELLRERKQIVIQRAVTQGLDPTVEMKDSGVEWIGRIPTHWEVVKLKTVATAKGRIGFRGYSTSDMVAENEGAITISPSNIVLDSMHFSKNSYLSWEKYHESPEIQICENDVLIVKTGSTFGKVGLVENLPCEATINPQLLVLKDVKISNKFIYEVISSNYVQTEIHKEVIGSTIPTISESKIMNLRILLPPSNEINVITNYIVHIRASFQASIDLHLQEIAKLKEYRTVLIDAAVTGKIRVSSGA